MPPTSQSEPAFFKIKDKAPCDCNGSRFVFFTCLLSMIKSLAASVIFANRSFCSQRNCHKNLAVICLHAAASVCLERHSQCMAHPEIHLPFLGCSSSPWTFTQTLYLVTSGDSQGCPRERWHVTLRCLNQRMRRCS